MKRISGEEIARIWNGDNDSGSEHDEAPANMIDFFPANEAEAEIEHLEFAIEMNRTYWRKEVDNLHAEIDELVSAVEFLSKNIAPHGLNTLLRNGSTTGELIAKHKGVCPSCNIDGFNNGICGNCGYGFKPKHKREQDETI